MIKSAFLAVCACVTVIAIEEACLVGEASNTPKSESRPTIVRTSLVPGTAAVLTHFPSQLKVPVELDDPTARIAYSVFIDYDPFTGEGLVDVPTHSDPAGPSGTRVLTISLPTPLDLDRCHLVEVIVALRFVSETNPKSAHTPDAPGAPNVASVPGQAKTVRDRSRSSQALEIPRSPIWPASCSAPAHDDHGMG